MNDEDVACLNCGGDHDPVVIGGVRARRCKRCGSEWETTVGTVVVPRSGTADVVFSRHVPRREVTRTTVMLWVAGGFTMTLFVLLALCVLLNHLWHDDQRERLLGTRTNIIKVGSATVATFDEPCIIRDVDRYDCMPRTTAIETDLAAYRTPITMVNADFNGSITTTQSLTPNTTTPVPATGTFESVGLYYEFDPTNNAVSSGTSDPCSWTEAAIDRRFVAQISDRRNHRTVYVPCQGMVYVVPDDPPATRQSSSK